MSGALEAMKAFQAAQAAQAGSGAAATKAAAETAGYLKGPQSWAANLGTQIGALQEKYGLGKGKVPVGEIPEVAAPPLEQGTVELPPVESLIERKLRTDATYKKLFNLLGRG